MYAICRTLKIKSEADITASDNHCRRIVGRGTEDGHIDPNLTKYNYSLSDKPLNELYQETMNYYNAIQPRKDSVKIVEFMLSISPSYFEGVERHANWKDNEKLKEFVTASHEFLNRLEGAKLLNMTLHVDEPGAAPHIHAHVVVLDERKRDGKVILNASKLLDGKKKMRELQDLYYLSMSQRIEGLQRGIPSEITNAKHINVKEFRKSMALLSEKGLSNAVINDVLRELSKTSKDITKEQINTELKRIIESKTKKGRDFDLNI